MKPGVQSMWNAIMKIATFGEIEKIGFSADSLMLEGGSQRELLELYLSIKGTV